MRRQFRHFSQGPAAICLLALCLGATLAAPPDGKGGGKGGSEPPSGDSNSAYSIIDLPGPYHDLNHGESSTTAYFISDPSEEGTHYICGSFWDEAGNTHPCLWTVFSDGSFLVDDISGAIIGPTDVNSAGTISGSKGSRPALLFTDGSITYLADNTTPGEIFGLSNPNDDGFFYAVGYLQLETGGVEPTLWELESDGTVTSATPLMDTDGQPFYAVDIRATGVMAGRTVWDNEVSPAIASYNSDGELVVSLCTNPNPQSIDGFRKLQVDDFGNMLGYGYQNTDTKTVPKTVIWPIDAATIDLSAVTQFSYTEGNGIATVNGTMQVVGGTSGADGVSGFLYQDGTLEDLQKISSGEQLWDFDRAEGISNAGAICGVGRVGQKRHYQLHAFMLLPNSP